MLKIKWKVYIKNQRRKMQFIKREVNESCQGKLIVYQRKSKKRNLQKLENMQDSNKKK